MRRCYSGQRPWSGSDLLVRSLLPDAVRREDVVVVDLFVPPQMVQSRLCRPRDLPCKSSHNCSLRSAHHSMDYTPKNNGHPRGEKGCSTGSEIYPSISRLRSSFSDTEVPSEALKLC